MIFGKDPNIKLQFDDPEPEGKYKRKFWVPMRSKDRNNPEVLKEQGSVLVSLDLLTKAEYYSILILVLFVDLLEKEEKILTMILTYLLLLAESNSP